MIQAGASEFKSRWRRQLALLACLILALGAFAAVFAPPFLPRLFFFHQDALVLGVLVALLGFASLSRRDPADTQAPSIRLTWKIVAIGAAVLALLLWAGTYLLFDNFPLSRDEQLAVFDSEVFRTGRLAAPLPEEWRRYVVAMTPHFLQPIPGNVAWISGYMPAHAMLRALFGLIGDSALTGPVLAAVGALATFDCSRRLFPGNRGCQAVALLIYATSAQVLVTAMTPYAMTAHLALNMVWLSFFLRNRWQWHLAALGVGFVAVGLHQIIFHPLFALPFIDHLRRQGQWRTVLLYFAGYCAIALFWLSYPQLATFSLELRAEAGIASGPGGFVADRILPVLVQGNPHTFELMLGNLLRFVVWQNLALLPLMVLAWSASNNENGIARTLFHSLFLTILAIALLLPYQGHGWGYRYLHGVIGNCALLAAYGWRKYESRPELRGFVRTATIVTLFGTIPFLAWQARGFSRPYALVSRMIGQIDADIVIVQSAGAAFAVDLVRNRANLSNRPKRLASHLLTPEDIAILCGRGKLAFVTAQQMQGLGVRPAQGASSEKFDTLRAAAAAPACVSPRRSPRAR